MDLKKWFNNKKTIQKLPSLLPATKNHSGVDGRWNAGRRGHHGELTLTPMFVGMWGPYVEGETFSPSNWNCTDKIFEVWTITIYYEVRYVNKVNEFFMDINGQFYIAMLTNHRSLNRDLVTTSD